MSNGSESFGPGMQKPVGLVDATFGLFGFLPHDADPRWEFLERYWRIKKDMQFTPMNFANAWGATYLSNAQSHRNGFVTTYSPWNALQLQRALDNLSAGVDVTGAFNNEAAKTSHDARFAVTDSLTTDPARGRPEVTPCPEALYQYRLFANGMYLARVGINVHKAGEGNNGVMSIANIQGGHNKSDAIASYKKEEGISPFNLLVQGIKRVSGELGLELRGLINPAKGNAQLYWGVLDAEGIPKYHAPKR